MIKIKSFIKYDNANALEVTWVDEVISTQEVEIEGEATTEDKVVETIIHCQAYADVQIDLLREDANKYGTSLNEYEELIAEVEADVVLPTSEEIAEQERLAKLAECYAYLASTDYKMTIDYYGSMTESDQVEVTTKRAEAREFIRANK